MDNAFMQLLFLQQFLTAVVHINKLKQKREQKRRRRLWSHNWLLKRDSGWGVLNMLENELRFQDPDSYKNFLRMPHSQFEELLNLIREDIAKCDTNMRQSVSPVKRLAVTLRFLATGETYKSLMYSTRIHMSTISLFIPHTCKCIYEHLKDKYLKMPSTVNDWLQIAKDFEEIWNFPMCIGAIDGKHILFRPPRKAGSFYYNYKGNHSIVLLAMCDATYKFTYIDTGTNGRMSDGGVFARSTLKQGIDLNLLAFPANKNLPGQNTNVPYVIVADDAFPLSNRIMKPYPQRGLTKEKRIYNYRQSRARRIIEDTFGILANRFRILLNNINLNPEKVDDIVWCYCALHNFLVSKNHKTYTDITGNKHSRLPPLHDYQGSSNHATNEAQIIRNQFTEYFNTVGAVPWQNKCLG